MTDFLARSVGEKQSSSMGQPVLIENRTGASGMIGSDAVAKAAPHGYALLMAFPAHTVNPSLFKKMPYDTVREFAAVSRVGSVPQIVFVHPDFPAKTLKELVAYAKERPATLNYGSVGVGSLGFLASELLASTSGIKLVHVPYKGQPQLEAALLTGEIHIVIAPNMMPLANAGRLRALAVASKGRLPQAPSVPTAAESGVPEFEVSGWNGILAPANTPRAIVDRLNAEIRKALRASDLVARFVAQGIELIPNSPDEFSELIKSDIQKTFKSGPRSLELLESSRSNESIEG